MARNTSKHRVTALLAAAAIAVALLALGCSSSGTGAPTASSTLAATAPPPTPTVTFPVAPADHDAPVWDFVRQWQGANISPILRPTVLPPGLETVTIGQLPNKIDPYLLSVEYSGPSKRLRILAGGVNAGPGDYQQTAIVRGHDAVLALAFATNPDTTISVWWAEPGAWVPDARAPAYDHITYEVLAHGLTQQELLQVAESLTPLAP